jgi:hypothetical protein
VAGDPILQITMESSYAYSFTAIQNTVFLGGEVVGGLLAACLAYAEDFLPIFHHI